MGQLLLLGLLLSKLWWFRLHKTYRVFTAFLAISLGLHVLFQFVEPGSNRYAALWKASMPILWVMYFLVVLELYTLVLRDYQGILSLGRWALTISLGAAVLITALTLSFDYQNLAEAFPDLRPYFALHRIIFSALLLFLVLITAFFCVYPVPLRRNVVVYCLFYFALFATKAVGFLVRNLLGAEVMEVVNLVDLGVTNVSLAVWLVLLNKAGERRKTVVASGWRPDQEQALLNQLGAINASLLRSARR
jgi:hypothetical protein